MAGVLWLSAWALASDCTRCGLEMHMIQSLSPVLWGFYLAVHVEIFPIPDATPTLSSTTSRSFLVEQPDTSTAVAQVCAQVYAEVSGSALVCARP